jgi:hypothetical protein
MIISIFGWLAAHVWYLLGGLLVSTGVALGTAGVIGARRRHHVKIKPMGYATMAEFTPVREICRYCQRPAVGVVHRAVSRERLLHCETHVAHAVAEATR